MSKIQVNIDMRSRHVATIGMTASGKLLMKVLSISKHFDSF